MEHEKAVKKISETSKKAQQLEQLKQKNDQKFLEVPLFIFYIFYSKCAMTNSTRAISRVLRVATLKCKRPDNSKYRMPSSACTSRSSRQSLALRTRCKRTSSAKLIWSSKHRLKYKSERT